MHVEVCLTPQEVSAERVRGRVVVVLDILRASSTLVEACAGGVREVWPEASLRAARDRARRLGGRDVLLGGERGGRRLPGFDLGNSPREYRTEVVRDRVLVFTTSNGTRAISRAARADGVWIGCFRNLGAVARRLRHQDVREAVLVCAGQDGRLSLEDLGCAGALLERLAADGRPLFTADNAGLTARALARAGGTPHDLVRDSTHGRRLVELGFGEDLEFCAAIDAVDTVPELVGGRLLAARD